jgi:hypothetical protein
MTKTMEVVLVLASIAACSSTEIGELDGDKQNSEVSGNAPGTANKDGLIETQNGLPCDVDKILKEKCQTCHGAEPKFGAPNALVTWDDLQKPGQGGAKTYERVKARVHDEARLMPPSPQPKLDDKELAAIDAWVGAGAKTTDAKCTGKAPGDGVKPLSCKPDTILKSPKAFTMEPGSALDQYVCFGYDVEATAKRHVTALAPHVDNKQIVHHILLFQTTSSYSPEPQPCEAFGSAAWKLVAGWAPGGTNLELPEAAGFPEEQGTTHWVVQVHYNNATAKTGTDNSGYELCTTDKLRPNDAGVIAFGSTNFNIPPRASHTIACDYTLGGAFDGVKFFNASPHMHTRGVAMSTERLAGGDGTPEPIFDQKNFSFEAQANFPIDKSVNSGDVMRTRCSWKNPGDDTIKFGEGTGDEMCFNFIGYYPNIPDRVIFGIPAFTWVTPAYQAQCQDVE